MIDQPWSCRLLQYWDLRTKQRLSLYNEVETYKNEPRFALINPQNSRFAFRLLKSSLKPFFWNFTKWNMQHFTIILLKYIINDSLIFIALDRTQYHFAVGYNIKKIIYSNHMIIVSFDDWSTMNLLSPAKLRS